MNRKRTYCSYCGGPLVTQAEGNVLRDFCPDCRTYFYDNPLPVVSSIVVKNREILLVKRRFEPKAGTWCLPMGFAESGESIETAALRELEEESGIEGRITGLVNIESGLSSMYGDLLFITFEVEWTGAEIHAGDDASEARFFSFDHLPPMAFSSNLHAIRKYLVEKQEYWAIMDSFSRVIRPGDEMQPGVDFLSAKLIRFIEQNVEVISVRWLEDVRTNRSTPTFARMDAAASLARNTTFIKHYRQWLEGRFSGQELKDFYQDLGKERKSEGFSLSEMLSAISLTRKHIWEFALTQGVWNRTIDIYMALELERNMMLFFDKVSYHITLGFEK